MSPSKHMFGLNSGASLTFGNFLMLTALIYYLLFVFHPFLFMSSVLLFFRVLSAFHLILIHKRPLKVMVPFLIAGCPVIILVWRDFWEVLRERVHWRSSQLTANFNQSKLFCLHKSLNYANAIVVRVRPIISWLQKDGWSNQRWTATNICF